MADANRIDDIQGEIIHVYDGIEEADNRLPNWWLATLYLAIAFSAVYWFYYHVYEAGPLPHQAYAKALAANAGKGGKVTAELLEALVLDPQAVAEGATIFKTNCVACHEPKGQGKIGANLTDAYWIHGGSPTDIHKIIHDGVATKGMPAWGAMLGPDVAKKVTAYVMTLRNTNVPGKAVEGTLWSEPAAGDTPTDSPSTPAATAPSPSE